MKQASFAILIAAILFTTNVFAGGPAYSRYGFGDLVYFGGSRSYAIGGAAAGLFGDGFINRLNPAGLAGISATRFSGSFEFSNYASNDGLTSGRYARGDFSGLSVALPISKDYGIVFVGEMTPYSNVNYAIDRNDSQFGIASSQQYYGSGGILRFDIGSSVSITDKLHVGFKANYLAGTILQNTKIAFTDNSYANSELDRRYHYSGAMFTIGAMYEGFSDLLSIPVLKPLVLGFVVESRANLDVRQLNISSTAQDYDTTLTQYGSADVPLFLAIGGSYTFSQRIVVAADLAMQDWSNAKSLGVHPPELRNMMRLGGGIELLPSKDASGYWDHVIYRAGFYYSSTYLQINGQPINGMFATAGLGLPIGPDSYLNIGLQLGINGTTSNNLQKDTIFRLSASISGSELWFNRFEED